MDGTRSIAMAGLIPTPARPGQRPRKMPTDPELATSPRHGATPAMQEEQL